MKNIGVGKNLHETLRIIFVQCAVLFGVILCQENHNIGIVTYVENHEQQKAVKALVSSIREFGGKYQNSAIYVVLGDTVNFPGEALRESNIKLIPLEMKPAFRDYPLAFKAFAMAQVEKRVGRQIRSLIWMDPGVIVINSLDALILDKNYDVALRPVTLTNNIALPPGEKPNDYWKPIYDATGLNGKQLSNIKTIVDEVEIQPYYNCEVYAVNPKLGLCQKWAQILANRLEDQQYQDTVCTTFTRKLFLHQVVLSGVLAANVKPNRIKTLPLTYSYPFNQHERLSKEKQVKILNDLSVVIFDFAWEQTPDWLQKIPVDEPLKSWLSDAYLDYLKLSDRLYRVEGSCNSYLITTAEGSVLIDPAGALIAPEYFRKILTRYPLKVILLTHCHQDHCANLSEWLSDTTVTVIAQREINSCNEYRARLTPFFARRGAIWSRQQLPDSAKIHKEQSVVPTITYLDEYNFELGGLHFYLTHTPGETPDHTTIWIPELQAVFVGDNYYEYFINNATLRGTSLRPVLGYIQALDLALSYKPEYFLPGHGAPIIAQAVIGETVENLRDGLRYIYDKTIDGINAGKDVYTLMQEIIVPEKYKLQPYFGKVEWTVRGIYHENIGWFDENPASMYALPPSSIYPELVETAGIEALNQKAVQLLSNEEYIKVLHLTDIVLKSNPDDRKANEIRSKALEALRSSTRNYIERIWLDYGIRTAREAINEVNIK